MDPFSLVSMQHLSRNHWPKERLIWNFKAKFGELWGNPRKYKSHTALRHRCCIDTVAKFGELWGNPRKYKSHTLPGRKFALLEGLSHDLKSVPDPFIMSILRGRCGTVNYHPVLKLIN